jgi:hypothetical protein
MEPDASVMLIWPMAAMEAQASGWPEIEPAHLLCAILKFAELDVSDLERLSEANSDVGDLRQQHRHLREHLDDPWGVTVPEVSAPLRRGLRRRGDSGRQPRPGGMIHRSAAAREVFRVAQETAKQAGRQRFDLVDLTSVLLHKPDEWIRTGLDQRGIISASQLVQRDQTIEQWGDVLVPLASSGIVDEAEGKRILAAPAVRVLADILAQPTSRPCLLIHGPDRTAHDVVIDLLNRPSDRKPPKIVQVSSLVLLQRISADTGLSAVSFLDFLIDEANRKTIWFFDSLHRYLAEEMAPSTFRLSFIQWLKHTNSRFLFAISEGRYSRLADQHIDWEDTFQLIWIRSSSQSVDMQL